MIRKPWPDYAATEYHTLTASCHSLNQFTHLMVYRAVFGLRNTCLLESLFQLIPVELRRIKQSCLIANQKRSHQNNTGRFPQWVVATIEDTITLSDKILEGLNMMEEAYAKRNWELIQNLAHLIQRDTLDLQANILSGPPPTTNPPNPVNQLTNIAEIAWQVWDQGEDN